ncbi:MAG: tetratricopeptide repeat protein [Burkholderiales bacterium]
MQSLSLARFVVPLLLTATLLGGGAAIAQTEPTMGQIYATAQAGKLDDAQVMVQQVLVSHPNSAKAHFVRAELYARQGDLVRARDSLASAEKFAPGLPFAKPDAVQALRTQLASKPATHAVNPSIAPSHAAQVSPPSNPSSWGLPLLLAAGVLVAGYFLFRKKTPQPEAQSQTFTGNGLSGPQSFGLPGGGAMQGGGAYPGYAPAQAPGMGSRIAGGLATGLAVGAGVMAAQAIGRNLMGGDTASGHAASATANELPPVDSNPDMGGANFGVNDGGSWDDAGSSDSGSGGDWDN